MTRYTVVWVESAQNELAELWLVASDRQAIRCAADTIDQELAENASQKGDELSEGLRSLDVPPLSVVFEVSDDDRLVEVACVWCG